MKVNANELLASIDKEKTLNLPMRQNLWRSYGEVIINGEYAEKTNALSSRVKLAMGCIDYVNDLWREDDTIDLRGFRQKIQAYIDEKIEVEELEQIYYKYRSLTEDLNSTINSEEYECIAMACCYVAIIALYDEPLLVEDEGIKSDDDLDSSSWDTSYLVSLIIPEEDKISFWKWYISEAEKIYDSTKIDGNDNQCNARTEVDVNKIKKQLLRSLKKEEELILPMRQKLWRLFGDAVINGEYAEINKALINRVKLAMGCIDYVKDFWIENDSINLRDLLPKIQAYIDGKIQAEELEQIYQKYCSLAEHLDSNCSDEYESIAMACCYVALIALHDEPLLEDDKDIESDDDLDSSAWDTSYWISLVDDDEEFINSFWKWYINEAVKLMLL